MEHGELKSNPSILEEMDIKQMLELRRIKEEDWHLLEELADIPKDLLIVNFHNFFNNAKERSEQELSVSLERGIVSDELKRYYEIWLYFAKNYDWTACYNMERVLERRLEK